MDDLENINIREYVREKKARVTHQTAALHKQAQTCDQRYARQLFTSLGNVLGEDHPHHTIYPVTECSKTIRHGRSEAQVKLERRAGH
jgi:hypothetical protein